MRSIEAAKNLIEGLMKLQEQKVYLPCPRCGHYRMDTDNPVRNALSRYAKVYICDQCGTDEAIRDFCNAEPMPLNEWAMVVGFDAEDGNLAEKIADFMVKKGTEHTMSGNWHFDFDEINEMFGADLPADDDLLTAIEDAVWDKHYDKVAELYIVDDFDFMFYLACCPNADEEENV